jgi:cytochrome c biogenesis protein CcmG/thiol:disulfide interchange protein DsbE
MSAPDHAGEPEKADPAPSRRGLLIMAPLAVVGGLGVLFFSMLGKGNSALPSALVGKSVPAFSLTALEGSGVPGLTDADLKTGKPTIVNFFASWCPDCHVEHPYLVQLSKDGVLAARGVRMVGIAQKDQPENTRRFLGAGGNPYSAIGMDAAGRTSIDFGVYGIPETFVVRGDGVIMLRHIGAVSEETMRQKILPALEKAERGG